MANPLIQIANGENGLSVRNKLNTILGDPVNVKLFGATGDGVTDDLPAIQAASNYAGSLVGGGVVLIPAGHYVSPGNDGINLQNFVQYIGEGDASFLDFNWNVFNSLNGGTGIGRTVYGTLTYYAANNIAVGDEQITATVAGNAANFAVNDIIMAVSTTSFVNNPPTDVEPYYVEVNRVTAVNALTGVISLEDPITDGWVGVKIANVTSLFVQNATIRNLRCRSNFAAGAAPFKSNGSYKCVIDGVNFEGAEILAVNGFVRSVARNITGTVKFSNAINGSIFEIATGSHNSSLENFDLSIYNTDGNANKFTPYTLNEFSRRINMDDLSFDASELSIGTLFSISSSFGFSARNMVSNFKSADLLFQCDQPVAGIGATIGNLPILLSGVESSANGTIVNGLKIGGNNVNIDGFLINGTVSGYGIGITDNVTNADLSHVIVNGTLTDPAGAKTLTNVVVRDSSFSGCGTSTILNSVILKNNTRYGSAITTPVVFIANAISPTTPNNVVGSLTFPANSVVNQFDHIDISLIGVKGGANGTATIQIVAIGSTLASISIPAATTEFEMKYRLSFWPGTFTSPNLLYLVGHHVLGGVWTQDRNNVAYNPAVGGTVQVQAWLANAADNITFVDARMNFVPNESDNVLSVL